MPMNYTELIVMFMDPGWDDFSFVIIMQEVAVLRDPCVIVIIF